MKTIRKTRPSTRMPKPGMIIEPVITYEELPIVNEQEREELLNTLQASAEDLVNGRGKVSSVGELKAQLRKSFEETTGFKLG